MSDKITLYILDETRVPTTFAGSDREKWEALVGLVGSQGERWHTLAMLDEDFDNAVCEIDEACNGKGFIPVISYNNSPHDVLGDDADCPMFGYFTAEMTKDLLSVLEGLDDEAVGTLESMADVEAVYHAYLATAEEAVNRGQGFAVVHG